VIKDIKRKKEIMNELNCKFIIIKENENWRKNEQINKIIQNK